MKHIFFWAPVFGLFTGCSDTAPGGQQNAECYVRYLAPEAQLRAEMTLYETARPTNTRQPLALPDGIRYRDVLMSTVRAPQNTYRLERSGGYAPQHVFTWKDHENRLCTFAASLPAMPAFSFGAPVISRQRLSTFQWQGDPLEQGESLVFMWENAKENRTVPMEIIGTPGQNSIDFPAAQLSKLTPGSWTLYLVRKKRVQAKINDTAVNGVLEYYTDIDTLEIQ